MTGEALGDQGRLLGVVGHEPGLPQQPEAIDGPEPPGDGTGRHPLGGQTQGVPQGGAQERPGETIDVDGIDARRHGDPQDRKARSLTPDEVERLTPPDCTRTTSWTTGPGWSSCRAP